MSGPVGACPNCSAPITFRWSSAVQTVCASCRSVVVRHDVDLRAIGEVSDLRPDSSPIQLGTRGVFDGRPFTVVGRIAYAYDDGGWNEWHLAFADGASGWLSDAQAEFAVSTQVPTPANLPGLERLQVGAGCSIGDRRFEVTTRTQARYLGVDGDLPFEYWGRDEMLFVDLRGRGGHFATIDTSEATPLVFVGRFVEFDDLALKDVRALEDPAVSGVRGFNCGNCGAAVELRALSHTRTVACTSCATILDPADPNLKVLQDAALRERITPRIPLGSKGTWHGHPHQVVGFQERSIQVEGERYAWQEYVLFNPYRGYRYVSEYRGHWNDIRTLRDLIDVQSNRGRARAEHKGTEFEHFQHATARTDFVLGEFPWTVRTGDTALVDDYVDPPRMLSAERTGDERTWSMGEYIDGHELWQAFSAPGEPPSPVGVFANQPNPYAGRVGRTFAAFLALALLLAFLGVGRLFTADREQVFSGVYAYAPAAPGAVVERAFVTDPFTLSAGGNVEIGLTATVSNAWIGWDLALIDVESGVARNVASSLEFYSGTDSDGAWTEGRRDGRVLLPPVPAGQYYLRVEPESDSRVPVQYGIRLRRDVPTILPYVLAFAVLLLPPVLVFLRSASFEHRRMQESDYGSGGGDDDEED